MAGQVHQFPPLGPLYPFGAWRVSMEDRLKLMRLWKAVERPPVAAGADPLPDDVREAHIVEDEQALSVIRLGCGPSASSIIRKCKTAPEAWDLLIRTYAAQSAGRMMSLKRGMNQLIQAQSESISAYVERASAIQAELEELGAGLSSAELATNILLGTLPAYKAQRDMIRAWHYRG